MMMTSTSTSTLARGTAGAAPPGWHDALIPRVAAGERQAWRAFHRHHFPIALAFLRKLGVRSPDLEDACQEVFLQVHRYLPRFRGDALIKTWLYRLCITEARKVRRRRWVGRSLARGLSQELPERSVPAATHSDATVQSIVRGALEQVGAGERLAFVLFEMEGRSGKEIADITGSSLQSVWRRVFQARHVVRLALGAPEKEN
jgi:RNA polymerase sigma-70 factor, ECF subfamily